MKWLALIVIHSFLNHLLKNLLELNHQNWPGDRSLRKENSIYIWQLGNRLVTSSRLLLFSTIVFIKKSGFNNENEVRFFVGFLKILFQNILFRKGFTEYIGNITGYLQKLNKGLELVSAAHFQYIFLWQFSLCNT